MSDRKSESKILATAGLAAVFASACCLGPLALVSIGVGGAWIANLQALEPYRPLFLGIALAALFFAWRRIYRPETDCPPGQVCALPQTRHIYKIAFWIVAMLSLVALTFPYLAPLFY